MAYAMLVVVNSHDPVFAHHAVSAQADHAALVFVGEPWPVEPLSGPPEDHVYSTGHCVRQLLEQKMST